MRDSARTTCSENQAYRAEIVRPHETAHEEHHKRQITKQNQRRARARFLIKNPMKEGGIYPLLPGRACASNLKGTHDARNSRQKCGDSIGTDMTFDRLAALPRGHKLYTSPATLKRSPWRVDNDNYESRGKPCAWVSKPDNRPIVRSTLRVSSPSEPETDAQYWLGSRYAPANDNNADRRWKGESNYGPDADYIARRDNPGTSRTYGGDVLSRLVAEGDVEAAFVLRAVGRVLSPVGMAADNDNAAPDADVEFGDGIGLDYAMEQDKAEAIIESFIETGRVPFGQFKFRQRSGAGGCKLMARHRAEEREGLHVDRYLALRGVAKLPEQTYFTDGETPWWRSHASKNAAALADLAAACDRTDWRKVTWTRYAPMPARVYGALGIYSEMKGIGEGKTEAAEHRVVQELRRSAVETEFRKRMPEHAMQLIDLVVDRNSYTKIAETVGLSRNGVKRAIKDALKEAWTALSGITGEEMPERKEKLAA